MKIDDMWRAYAELKMDRDAFDQLTLQLSTTIKKIDNLEGKIEKITSELAVTKQVNSVLKSSISSLQRKLNVLEQYGRKENVEISGVPKNTPQLENKNYETF